MERKRWDGKQKLHIVLEGLSGKVPVAELCNKYQINQGQYYKWRDQLLSNGVKAFDTKDTTTREAYLQNEVKRLTSLVGELTVELKKNEFDV